MMKAVAELGLPMRRRPSNAAGNYRPRSGNCGSPQGLRRSNRIIWSASKANRWMRPLPMAGFGDYAAFAVAVYTGTTLDTLTPVPVDAGSSGRALSFVAET